MASDIRALVLPAANGESIDLGDAVEGSWDRIQILRPGWGNEEAYRLLGIPWQVEETYEGFFDGDNRWVIVADGEVTAWARIAEEDVSVCDSAMQIDAGDSILVVIVEADGSHWLRAEDGPILDLESPTVAC